ncbi:hypothetical protein [Proteiniborus sp. MB09-C3]|uniref:hypothetical protein n=1 Tax=Proteiniborus sp. MB09-C3 TaxID=3050072 RepID=UPI002556C532|nr:hypothetical protein [Proteiniborus sp. MB09-C3]WIV12296.1 hypothetical protein QO263_00810 [Proteiniborus sp. MB09-C3]
MSRFLAPIHFWLFDKIKYHENLEKNIIKGFKESFGEEVNDIEDANIKKYGERISDKPLDELIDINNIHGWLQEKIKTVETRQAAILADLFAKYKDHGILLAKNIYKQDGIALGKDAKSKYDTSTPKDIYDALNNYILNGMPCDNVNSIRVSEDDYLEYSQSKCLHKGYWNEAGADPRVMYDLRTTWTGSFVNTANPDFKYQVNTENLGQEEGFLHKIFKK